MGITILERLHDEQPCGRRKLTRNKSLQVIYDLVRKHLGEIEEAIARGYSWKQIDEACRESWQVHSKAARGINWWTKSNLIEDCYHAVVHGRKVGDRKKTAPLSLEVTVTKR